MKPKLLIAGAAVALAATACTSPPEPDIDVAPWVLASAQLTTYDSCEEALDGIHESILATLSQMQFTGLTQARDGIEFTEGGEMAAAEADDSAGAGETAGGTSFSETNNAVSGVDEPDMVKTDGDRIYSVVENVLRVVDAQTTEVVAEHEYSWETWEHRLFLGDDELLVMYTQDRQEDEDYYSAFTVDRLDIDSLDVLDTFNMDGSMVDARMVDGEVRLSVSSSPRIAPLWEEVYDGDDDTAALREAVRETEIEDWLPNFSVNGNEGQTGCDAIAHPDRFGGNSTVSVFALPSDGNWTDVETTTVMADGGIVHGTADSLYLAHYDYQWGAEEEPQSETELYRFVFDGGSPRLAGEASVAGTLLNQYSMSEYDGHLRVAATENNDMWMSCPDNADCAFDEEEATASKSTVTVFAVGDDALEEVGSVSDLGVDEQIYAVRFIGPTGYVVTFRQTDPLYTLDLSDPASPVVTGELKITGYSAYLHPVGADRLLGVGQEADQNGRTIGLQASLFDIGGAEASVLDQYERWGSSSGVEWDPHAFLYWADERIAVMPVTDWSDQEQGSGAVVLQVGDDSLTEAAWIEHDGGDDPYQRELLRSLVIGDQLWTLSNSGLMATELGGEYTTAAWVGW